MVKMIEVVEVKVVVDKVGRSGGLNVFEKLSVFQVLYDSQKKCFLSSSDSNPAIHSQFPTPAVFSRFSPDFRAIFLS